MTLVRRVVVPLRAALALLFALLLVLQTLSFPGQFAHMAREHPDQADLRWPLTAFVAVELLCVQVILVCTWRLLTMVRDDEIFTGPALRWVDGIVGAFAAAWVLAAAVSLWAVWGGDPGNALALFVVLLIAAAFGLVVVVLRELLRQATTLRTEMEAVI